MELTTDQWERLITDAPTPAQQEETNRLMLRAYRSDVIQQIKDFDWEFAEHVNAHQELSQAGAIMASVDKLGYAKAKLDEAQAEHDKAAKELQQARLAAGRVNA